MTTKPRAAQAAYRPKMDEARQLAAAQQTDQRNAGRLLLSADDLRNLGVPYSRVQLWKMVKAGLFVAPIKISPNRNAWIHDEVIAWVAARAAERAA
jgi:predicted DNA-binding transcriptional regulator AlpA